MNLFSGMAFPSPVKTTLLLSLFAHYLAATAAGTNSGSGSSSIVASNSLTPIFSNTTTTSSLLNTTASASTLFSSATSSSSSSSSSTAASISTTGLSSSIDPTSTIDLTSTTYPSSSTGLTSTTGLVLPTPPLNIVISGSLGPITLGPQTSTESGAFISMQTGIPGLTANSATQTSKDGHNTILPIWFLSRGIGIIKLPPAGIEIGGIIPPPPGFPPLFIGPDGNPTTGGPPQGTKDPQTSSTDSPSSSNPSSSSLTCTTTAASRCVETCTPTTNSQGSQTVTCGQPSCATIVGCSVTVTTSTTTLAQSSCTAGCPTCYSFQGDGQTVPADNGGNDNLFRRSQPTPPSIAGRVALPLEKRADNFNTFNPNTPNACTLAKNLIIPNYPTPGKLPSKSGAQFWFVMTETTAPNTCPVLDYNFVSDADVTSQKINPADTNTYTKGGDWSRTNPTVNVDHVYELSILKQYFSSRITAANCDAFKAIFDVPDQGKPQVAGDTRLQTIWRQLPSNTNPDFAGMDAKINAIKAQAFSNAFSNPSGSDNSLGYLYQLALAMKLTNDPQVSPLFQNTNNRIYAALLGMDALINAANNCGSSTTVIQGDWASSYKTWITNLLTTAGNQVNNQVSVILNDDTRLGSAARIGSTTGQDGKATTTTNSIGRGVNAFLNAYPTPDAFTFNVNSLVDFPITSTLLVARQGGACSISVSSASQPVSTLDSTTTTKSATNSEPASTSPTPKPPSTTLAPISSSTPVLPSSCPDGCQCIQAAQGGCDCLCS